MRMETLQSASPRQVGCPMAIRAVCRNLMQDGLYILLGTLAFSLPPRFGSLRVLRRECCCASLVVQREARVMLVSPAVQLHLSLRCKHAAFAVQLLVGSVSLLKNGSHSAFPSVLFHISGSKGGPVGPHARTTWAQDPFSCCLQTALSSMVVPCNASRPESCTLLHPGTILLPLTRPFKLAETNLDRQGMLHAVAGRPLASTSVVIRRVHGFAWFTGCSVRCRES